MSSEMLGIIGIILLIVLFFLKVPVGVSLLLVGFGGYVSIRGLDIGLAQLGASTFDTAGQYSLSVIPLFILMGMILSYCGLGTDLFKAVDSWIGHIRGGLSIAAIGTSAVFSAISGSVNATTATVAKICLPEMEKYNYHPRLSTGSIAAGGTLGVLIPPSVLLILYGVLTGEPIGALLIAGIVPGLLQMLLFILVIVVLVKINPSLAPPRDTKATFAERIHASKSVVPFLSIFIVSIGGIYLGIFTPSEAASVGAFSAFIYALVSRRITWPNMIKAFTETLRLTSMIFLIIVGTTMFGQFLSISRIPTRITSAVASLDVSPYIILLLILGVLFVLGMFIEGLSIFVLTLPIVYPLIIAQGFDGIWFGVIMVLIVNIGLLTPPLGVSCFVIKGVAKEIPLSTIFRGAIPMIGAMAVCIILLTAFPYLVTFLNTLMSS